MSIIQGLKANQMNVVLVIQRMQGKVPGQTAVDELPRTSVGQETLSHPQDSLKSEEGVVS